MVRRRLNYPGFTLMELVLVMLIIAIVAGMLAPSLGRFTTGRAVDNLARQIIGLAQYARTQSISEGRTYRLNFDSGAGQFWLTADDGGGTFVAPSANVGSRYTAADGIKMEVTVTPQPNVRFPLPASVDQQSVTQSAQTLDGQQAGPAGSLMQNLHTQGVYVEFQPTGRTDPATIELTGTDGRSTQVACASPSEMFAVVADAGAAR